MKIFSNKLVVFIFIVFSSISAYAFCKETPIQEYIYMTEKELVSEYKANKNLCESKMKFADRYININALHDAREMMDDSKCLISNNVKIRRVLKKEFSYTEKMFNGL